MKTTARYVLTPEGEEPFTVEPADFIRDNELDEGDAFVIESLGVGEEVAYGGGASVLYVLRREA